MSGSPSSRIIGYGVCGPGEAEKYLRLTLENLKELCDDAIICLNNAGDNERKMVEQFGFKYYYDNREWGKLQWKIKEDLLRDHLPKLNPDWCITLDMDEVFDPFLTREKLVELTTQGHESYFTYVVDLWDDGYAPNRSFWKVQIWKWNGEVDMVRKPVHGGQVPNWAKSGAYAPYMMIHYGLKDAGDRAVRVKRYEKYDPDKKYIGAEYYYALANGEMVRPFDVDTLHQEIASEVASYHQPIKQKWKAPKIEYVMLRRLSDGMILDIPVAHAEETLKRGGFERV